MIAEAFLICALAVPGTNYTRPPIVSWHLIKSEEDRLRDWLRKNNPDADVFIHPEPAVDRLKEDGWEHVPFTWRGNQIWIKRKPWSDKKIKESA